MEARGQGGECIRTWSTPYGGPAAVLASAKHLAISSLLGEPREDDTVACDEGGGGR